MELSEIANEKKELETKIMADINNFFKKYPEFSLHKIKSSIDGIRYKIDGRQPIVKSIDNFKLICWFDQQSPPTKW